MRAAMSAVAYSSESEVTNTMETVGQCERQPLTVHPGGFQISALGEVESVNDRIVDRLSAQVDFDAQYDTQHRGPLSADNARQTRILGDR